MLCTSQCPSFPRTRESISLLTPSWTWISALAGMTINQRALQALAWVHVQRERLTSPRENRR